MDITKIAKAVRETKLRAFGLGDMVPILIAFVLVTIIGSVTLLILGSFASSPSIGTTCYLANTLTSAGVCSGGPTVFSNAYNGVTYGVSGIQQIMQFLPLIALVTVAAVIIGIVVGAFVLGGRKEEGF